MNDKRELPCVDPLIDGCRADRGRKYRKSRHLKIGVHIEHWPTIRPFRIAGKPGTPFESVVIELERNGVVGRGEALGVYYLGETAESLLTQIRQAS